MPKNKCMDRRHPYWPGLDRWWDTTKPGLWCVFLSEMSCLTGSWFAAWPVFGTGGTYALTREEEYQGTRGFQLTFVLYTFQSRFESTSQSEIHSNLCDRK